MAAIDLAQLMQYAPTVAAGAMGSQQALDDRKNLIDQANLQSIMQDRNARLQMAQQLQPFAVQKAGLDNDTLAAQLPGVKGDSASRVAKGQLATATLPSDIDATTAQNRMKTYETIGAHLGSIAGDVGDGSNGVPPHALLAQRLTDLGLPDSQVQAFVKHYANVAPSDLSKRLQDDSEKIMTENQRYRQAFDTTSLTTSSHIVAGAAANASHERVAQIMSNGRVEARAVGGKAPISVEEALRHPGLTARAKAELLEQAAAEAINNNDPQSAAIYTQRAQEARARAAEDASNTGLGGRQTGISVPGVAGLPANPAPAATAPIGTAGRGAPAASAPAPVGGAGWGIKRIN